MALPNACRERYGVASIVLIDFFEAHWHHGQATLFTTHTWISPLAPWSGNALHYSHLDQPTGTMVRQRSSLLTLGSAHWHHGQATLFTTHTWINTISPLAPWSGNALHYSHLDQPTGTMVRQRSSLLTLGSAHWHHGQATLFTTHTWINTISPLAPWSGNALHYSHLDQYNQPTGTMVRQRSSLLTLGSIQSAHWHHGQATLFTTHTWINTISPLAPWSGNALHYSHLDQQYMNFSMVDCTFFVFHAVHIPSKIPQHRNCQCFQ